MFASVVCAASRHRVDLVRCAAVYPWVDVADVGEFGGDVAAAVLALDDQDLCCLACFAGDHCLQLGVVCQITASGV